MSKFEKGLYPEFTFKGDGFELRKSILMPHDSNTVLLKYEVLSGDFEFSLRPFLKTRPADYLMGGNEEFLMEPKEEL